MQPELHDVVVVGAGPVGLAVGRLLGLQGHDVVILERWPEPYGLPRAVVFDDEIGRAFQSMGLSDEVKAISEPVHDSYEWRNAQGRTLVKIPWELDRPCGWGTSFFSQPELEQVLADAVTAMPNVRLRRGAEVVQIHETDDDVLVTYTSAVTKQRRIRARYVVGCDGANSFVRQRMGVSMVDRGFFFDWLVVDTKPHDEADWAPPGWDDVDPVPQNWQMCDPARPTTVVSGGPGRRRWEFMRLPGETRDSLNDPAKAWELLAAWGRTPENTDLERHAVYTFGARWADAWNKGRLILAGDAAHQMPPFAGQGMCSGMRDAANLSWKLDRVLSGRSGPALLDSYTSERTRHLQYAIAMSVALGNVICVLDPELAAERDARMLAGGADPAKVLPITEQPVLGSGIVATAEGLAGLAGTHAPQFPVETAEGYTALLDDVVGYGAVLLTSDAAAAARIGETHRSLLDAANVRVFTIGSEGCDLEDSTHAWSRWFTDQQIACVLLRPDHYVFGTAAAPERLTDLVHGYHAALAPISVATPVPTA
ncbi:bifunctional 3-(3-hydroxy-phenyl)propionate/3-hydroxycinnamic acid hydroxylase [Rhodococcus aetherivorans]|uniref:bifunctional 3-(3-hydroxy-phenyl)propionate/3-hydroxycinnamic acid hydroxylase MhpA n=2 Tax=Rhodococcus aetherivorans TaxID=191292 RepID=UPI00045CD703|nr:bifunctional 3-(3-hydroxy-phenyl)propionate/3-hydroxycinnamic acid hydroxylase [Rhodococcus aetherivorans]KDE13427.1 monooxygenase [Rhodococcus aetherivorans]